jgi:hypothetical protein
VATALDKVRHDVGEQGEEQDCGCRSGPCTLDARAEPVVDDVDTDVEDMVLLLRARHDDDKSAERVAVHAAQDAILCVVVLLNARKKELHGWMDSPF